MHLYSLTLQQPTAIQKAIVGSFSGPRSQEIVVNKGKVLEILRIDENGRVVILHQQEVFGLIRAMASFRFPGIKQDFIIITSDSGRIVILQYDNDKQEFVKVHQETYGKTGCRRIIPGQYIATDPCGRACMIAGVEKQKYVYILNQENGKLTISSPLEAHKSHTICIDIVGIDTEFENAQFACIEMDYEETYNKDSPVVTGKIQKQLTIYLMDFGLNHVIKHSTEQVPESAHMLISVPGKTDGPGGYIILCEGYLIHKNIKGEKRVPYPRRVGTPSDRKIMITSYVSHKLRGIFYLLQSELGDLFILRFNSTGKDVHNITMQYFDSIPLASSLCILRKGILFVPCEKGNHMVYKIKSDGSDEKHPILTDSNMPIDDTTIFVPRKLTNLDLMDEINNLSCITDMKVDDLTGEGNSQIYALCAAGQRSSLRILRHGLQVNEIARSPLPGKPSGIWSIRSSNQEDYSKYIVLSFLNQTLILAISDKVVEVQDSGMDLNKQTLHTNLLEDNSIIQVFPTGIKHVLRDKRSNQWMIDGKIVKAISNSKQLVLALAGGQIIYFEIDSLGQLEEIGKTMLDSEVTCLDVGEVQEGRQRFRFLAVGLADSTVKILSLDAESCLQRVSVQALPDVAESVCLLEMTRGGGFGFDRDNKQSMMSQTQQESFIQEAQLFLYIGMRNGVLMRITVDSITGGLNDMRTRFLGSRPVRCFKYQVLKSPALLALSSRPWICYTYMGKYYNVPLSYDVLDFATMFHTPECIEGIVSVSGDILSIIMPEKFGQLLNQTIIPLRYSPKKMAIHQESHNIVIIESDHRVYPEQEKENLKKILYAPYGEEGEEAKTLSENQIGTLMAPVGSWASCIRIFEPIERRTLDLVELENNEQAISMVITNFTGTQETFLCVGTVKDLELYPQRKFQCGFIHTYAFVDYGRRLELLHKTQLDDIPTAMVAWHGKLLVGVGVNLRGYDMGKKKLLKKCELKELNAPINGIQIFGDRIFVTMVSDSFHVYKYRPREQTFYEVSDDILPRWMTSFQVLDYHTVVGADKFENAFVCRIPQFAESDIDENPMFYKLRWETGYLNGAPFKMEQICNFYVGETITSIQKASLVSTGNEVMLHGSTMGSIAAFYPFENKEDIDFFLHLELYLRIEALPLCGREHVSFRSFSGPCKAVIDGDLCEQFVTLPYGKQKVLAEEIDRTPADVQKKLEDLRNRIL